MCITVNRKRPKISFRRINGYKIVVCDGGQYFTPFQNTKIDRKVIDGSKDFYAEGCIEKSDFIGMFNNEKGLFNIEGGMIHIFNGETLNGWKCAKSRTDICKDLWDGTGTPRDVMVFECYIPPFTRYYESIDGTEFAAKRIRFTKKKY